MVSSVYTFTFAMYCFFSIVASMVLVVIAAVVIFLMADVWAVFSVVEKSVTCVLSLTLIYLGYRHIFKES